MGDDDLPEAEIAAERADDDQKRHAKHDRGKNDRQVDELLRQGLAAKFMAREHISGGNPRKRANHTGEGRDLQARAQQFP